MNAKEKREAVERTKELVALLQPIIQHQYGCATLEPHPVIVRLTKAQFDAISTFWAGKIGELSATGIEFDKPLPAPF
jgi:hypothetical protein